MVRSCKQSIGSFQYVAEPDCEGILLEPSLGDNRQIVEVYNTVDIYIGPIAEIIVGVAFSIAPTHCE